MNPQLTMYHANAKGTGSAIKFTLHPARWDADNGTTISGCIMAKIANQSTIADRRSNPPRYATFDWDNSINVKLEFSDLTALLQVLRGECEQVGNGHGLYHVNAKRSQSIYFRHMIEPISGYAFEVYETSRDGKEETNARFVFSSAEALGFSIAIEQSFGLLAFGNPAMALN